MAVSDVAICKIALSHLGEEYNIESLSERSAEAELCNLLYLPTLHMMLRRYPWSFARKYATPAALSATPPANWAYMFTYPTDAARVWRLLPSTGHPDLSLATAMTDAAVWNPRNDPIRFVVGQNATDDKVVFTMEQEPIFLYTKLEEDTTKFDPEFDMALSYMLASKMAVGLTGSRELMSDMFQLAASYEGHGEESDATEEVEEVKADADWITARA